MPAPRNRQSRRRTSCCRRPLARALAELRTDLERVEASPDLVRRVRDAIRAGEGKPSYGRLAAVAALVLLSVIAGGGPTGSSSRPLAAVSPGIVAPLLEAAPLPAARADPALLAGLRARSAARRRAALVESAALLPHPPGDVRAAWRAIADDPDVDPSVRATARALLRAAEPEAAR